MEHEADRVPKSGWQLEHGIKKSEHDENKAKKAFAGEKKNHVQPDQKQGYNQRARSFTRKPAEGTGFWSGQARPGGVGGFSGGRAN